MNSPVKKDCPKGYKRDELVDLAKKLGIRLYRTAPEKGNKNMVELCGELKKIKSPKKKAVKRVSPKRVSPKKGSPVRDDCPKDYKRDELVEIAKSMGVRITREPPGKGNKTMTELCDSLKESKITKRASPKRASPKRASPKRVSPKRVSPKKGSPVRDDCPKDYKRDELVEIAKSMGVRITREPPGKGNKTMTELCDSLKEPKIPKPVIQISDDLEYLVDEKIFNENEGENKTRRYKLVKHLKCKNLIESCEIGGEMRYSLNKDLIQEALKCGIITEYQGAPRSTKAVCNNLQALLTRKFYNPKGEFYLKNKLIYGANPYLRFCDNEIDNFTGDSIYDIPQDKFIRTVSGTCYDIDNLIRTYISQNGKNLDPFTRGKIYENFSDFSKAMSKSTIDSTVQAEYNAFVEKKKEEKREFFDRMDRETFNIIDRIGKTGFIAINDNPTSHSENENVFKWAQKALPELYADINKSPVKDILLDFKTSTGVTLEDVLNSLEKECLHGIGFKLLNIYINIYDQLSEKYVDYDLIPEFIKGDGKVYYTFNITNYLPFNTSNLEMKKINYIIIAMQPDNNFSGRTVYSLNYRGDLYENRIYFNQSLDRLTYNFFNGLSGDERIDIYNGINSIIKKIMERDD